MNALVQPDKTYGLPTTGMAPGLAIMFNDALYDRCKQIAAVMSRANGFTPRHLLGQTEACFAVVTRSITWKLDPLAVAQSTYQTPNGAVGYEGKLVQAILENSGHLEGPVTFEHIGDWSKVQGKWKKGKSAKGYEIPMQGWEDKDEEGLGVIVRAKVRGEREPREFTMWLRECFPRNSTLWPIRPSQQICYTAVRAFANIAAPGLFMGVPFSSDMEDGTMIDVSPRPERRDFTESATRDAEQSKAEPTAATVGSASTAEAVDHETGEITEVGVPEAMELGREARCENRPRRPTDGLTEAEAEAWKAGWDEIDEEMQKAAKK